MKNQRGLFQPISEKEISEWARVASQAHKRATRKKHAELRQLGLPMIIWKDGRVREVPSVKFADEHHYRNSRSHRAIACKPEVGTT